MQSFAGEHLTSEAVALRLLETVNASQAKNVLYLGGNADVDYVRDTLLPGLKLVVETVVDFVRP